MSEISERQARGMNPAQLRVWHDAYREGYHAEFRKLSPAETRDRTKQDECVRAGWESADAAVEAMGEAK